MSFPTREYNLMLSVNSEFTQPAFKVKQNDSESTVFNIQLLNNFSAINLTGYTTKFTVKKPDGNIVFQTPTIVDAITGKIKVILTAQTLAVAGKAEAEVSIYGGSGERITLFEFIFEVDANIDPTNAIESSGDFPAMTQLVADSHTHANKTTLDKMPDTGTGNTGKVLTVHADGSLQWDFLSGSSADVTNLSIKVDEMYVIKHTHTNKVTLDLIPDNTSVPTGYVLTTGAGNTLSWTENAGGASQAEVNTLDARITELETDDVTQDSRLTAVELVNASQATAITNLQTGKSDTTHTHSSLYPDKTTTEAHITATNNPHSVTKSQVGLGNVDNTSDANKPISTATQTALNTINTSITGLQTSKANTAHEHTTADINGLDVTLTGISDNFTKVFVGSNTRGSLSVTDINAIVKSGYYYSTDMTNNPVLNNGFIIHNQFAELDAYATQLYIEYSKDTMYMRRKVDGTWNVWVQVAGATPPPVVKYLSSNFTTSTAGATSFPVGVAYDVAKDSIHVYINGLKLIKGKHYTADATTITLLNSQSLLTYDDVLVEVFTNSL